MKFLTTLNGGTPVTQTVNNALAGGASETTSFPGITLPAGENKIEYSTNVITGSSYVELVTGNNSSVSSVMYTMPTSAFAQTHEEGFEGSALGDAAPGNAISDNPDGVSALVFSSAAVQNLNHNLGGFGNSAKSYRWDFFSIPNGNSSKLVFEKLDFSTGTGHGVKFNHAYAQYSSENDKLEVLVSTDCGVTWTSVYSKQGSALATSPAVGNQQRFYPSVTQWKNNFVDLANYVGQSDVMIAFKGVSDYGNNLYLDDIQILDGTTISVEENELLNNINLYPNPSNGISALEINLTENALVNVSVYNNLGELVVANISNQLSVGTSNINLNLSELNNGVYFAHVTIAGETAVKQITLLK